MGAGGCAGVGGVWVWVCMGVCECVRVRVCVCVKFKFTSSSSQWFMTSRCATPAHLVGAVLHHQVKPRRLLRPHCRVEVLQRAGASPGC